VVDDEAAMREVLQARLSEWGFQVRTAATVEAARAHIAAFDPHVVMSDVVMPDASGMALLEQLDKDRSRTVVMMTAYGTIGTAVQAMKLGATEFLTKPLDYVAVHRLLDEVAARIPPAPRAAAALPADTGRIVGASRAVAELWSAIEAAASSEAPVLIVGESGTGKELVARTIHERGARGAGPFVPINAAAIPEALAEGELFGYERGAFTGALEARPGLIEQAHRGTLFLDEITEMAPALQPKLLRVLEDRIVRRVGARVEMESDARFIAATNRQPQQAVAEGRLRPDLRYRLDVLRVDVPPLRERTDDIPALAASFLADCAARYGRPSPGLTPTAIDALAAHAWPGNIRELRNAIERGYASARGEELEPAHLRLDPGERDREQLGIVIPRGVTAAAAERILILETLKATENNKAEAARRLGMDVKTIRNKLKAFGLSGDEP
jgi:two-component system response regulator PilR (NtrC family)